MKNPGSVLLMLALALAGARSAAAAATLEARLQPDRVEEGEIAMLELKVHDAASAEIIELPSVPGIEARKGGSQRFSNVHIVKDESGSRKVSESGVLLLVQLVPARAGSYSIPPVRLKAGTQTLVSPELVLTAVSAGHTGSRSGGLLRIVAEPVKRRVFTGEPIIIRYFVAGRGARISRKPAVEKFPEAKGFIVKEVREPVADQSVEDAGERIVKTHAVTLVLVPAEAGDFSVGGGSLAVETARGEGLFSFPRKQSLQFPKEAFTVIKTPDEGRPGEFHGDVGSFVMTAEYEKDPIVSFDEKRVRVQVKGSGNLVTLSRPEAPETDAIKVLFEEGSDKFRITENRVEGEREFIFTIVPESAGPVRHPGFKMSFFNPTTLKYETARTGAIAFEAREGSAPGKPRVKTEPGGMLPDEAPLVAGIAFGAGALVMLAVAWGKRRMRPRPETQARTVAGIPVALPKTASSRHEREMLSALRRGDGESFLRSAELFTGELLRVAEAAHRDEDIRMGLLEVRTRIYSCRYGGGGVKEEEFESIRARLEELRERREGGRS